MNEILTICAGNEWPGVLDVVIAGSVAFHVSKQSLEMLHDVGTFLSDFAGAPIRSGGTKVLLSRVELLFQGQGEGGVFLQLETSGVQMLHVLDQTSSVLAGFSKSFSLRTSEGALVGTLPFCSSPAFTVLLR